MAITIGHADFDTLRSPLGELVYRLKYKGGKNAIVEAVSWHLKAVGVAPEVIVPMPPSKQRGFQPLIEIATALAKVQAVLCSASTLTKVKMHASDERYRRLFGSDNRP